MNEELYDLIIIGAAAAGPAAAVYAARRHLKFAVVSTDIGGEVALSGEVENWLGIKHTTGFELAKQFEEHMKSYNPQIDIGYTVEAITQEGKIHVVHAKNYSGDEKKYKTKAVIIATGIHPRELGVKGETEFKHKGVTYCTVCDGPLYKGKITTTVGAGNSALESALMLGDIAAKAYLVTKYPDSPEQNGGFPKGENILIEKAKKHPNIEIIYSAMTKEIKGEQAVTTLVYTDQLTEQDKEIQTNGVMVHIGNIPNSGFIDFLDKDAAGQIITDKLGRTSCPGIFAAGDVTDIDFKQILISAGQGVTAALTAIDYINRLDI